MVRVCDLEASLAFFRDSLGLIETRRKDCPAGRFTLVYLGAPENPEAEVELTFNYDTEDYGSRSEEHTSELQSLMRISYAVFCLKKKIHIHTLFFLLFLLISIPSLSYILFFFFLSPLLIHSNAL